MTLSNSMTSYQVCARCVMDTSVDDIVFDEQGVCNYCQAASERMSREGAPSGDRLEQLVRDARRAGKGADYDCVIGVSGGVDSSYVAYLVKKKFGLRPLAVHFDNGWNSELAVRNIEVLLKALDIDLHTHVVDWEEFKDLQLSFIKASIANCEIPTDHAIVALLYKTAAQHGVKYILHGGNLATESIMPDTWMHDAKDLTLLKSVWRAFGRKKRKTMPTLGYIQLAQYVLVNRIKYVGVLNLVEYDKREAGRILEEGFGWRPYEGKHFESIFTRFFQGYLLPVKFGIDKRRAHFSSLIMSGQMTRAEALSALTGPPYPPDKAREDVEYVRQKFGLTETDFSEILAKPPVRASAFRNSQWLIDRFGGVASLVKMIATGRSRR